MFSAVRPITDMLEGRDGLGSSMDMIAVNLITSQKKPVGSGIAQTTPANGALNPECRETLPCALDASFETLKNRNTYLENNIKEPGKTTQCGVPIDLSKVKLPLYVLASREDHIVPWKTAYGSKDLIGNDVRFVLAASGHVAGVINPPARNKRSHWLNDELAANPQNWLEGAEEKPGSWWPDWDAWMKRHSNGVIPAPKQQGNVRYNSIEPAPGRYVKAKSN